MNELLLVLIWMVNLFAIFDQGHQHNLKIVITWLLVYTLIFKEIVHPKMNILSIFTHVDLNPTSIAGKTNIMEVNGYIQLCGYHHLSKYLRLCSTEETHTALEQHEGE